MTDVNLDNLPDGVPTDSNPLNNPEKKSELDSVENSLLGALNIINGYKTKVAKIQRSLAEQKTREAKKQYQEYKEAGHEYQEIKQRLLDFPDMIKEQKENIQGLEEYAQQASEELQVLEDLELMQISKATDDKGKKKYSNKEAREAALNYWKSDDEEYQAAKEALKSATRDLENAKFDLDRIYNDYKSCQKIADMMTARMNMFIS